MNCHSDPIGVEKSELVGREDRLARVQIACNFESLKNIDVTVTAELLIKSIASKSFRQR